MLVSYLSAQKSTDRDIGSLNKILRQSKIKNVALAAKAAKKYINTFVTVMRKKVTVIA